MRVASHLEEKDGAGVSETGPVHSSDPVFYYSLNHRVRIPTGGGAIIGE